MEKLNLSTGNERPVFTIDGDEYHLNTRADLRYKDIAFMGYAGQRLAKLSEQLQDPEQYSDEIAAEFDLLLERAARMAVHDVPDGVFDKLSDEHRMKLIEVFSEAVGQPEEPEGSRPDTSDQ